MTQRKIMNKSIDKTSKEEFSEFAQLIVSQLTVIESQFAKETINNLRTQKELEDIKNKYDNKFYTLSKLYDQLAYEEVAIIAAKCDFVHNTINKTIDDIILSFSKKTSTTFEKDNNYKIVCDKIDNVIKDIKDQISKVTKMDDIINVAGKILEVSVIFNDITKNLSPKEASDVESYINNELIKLEKYIIEQKVSLDKKVAPTNNNYNEIKECETIVNRINDLVNEHIAQVKKAKSIADLDGIALKYENKFITLGCEIWDKFGATGYFSQILKWVDEQNKTYQCCLKDKYVELKPNIKSDNCSKSVSLYCSEIKKVVDAYVKQLKTISSWEDFNNINEQFKLTTNSMKSNIRNGMDIESERNKILKYLNEDILDFKSILQCKYNELKAKECISNCCNCKKSNNMKTITDTVNKVNSVINAADNMKTIIDQIVDSHIKMVNAAKTAVELNKIVLSFDKEIFKVENEIFEKYVSNDIREQILQHLDSRVIDMSRSATLVYDQLKISGRNDVKKSVPFNVNFERAPNSTDSFIVKFGHEHINEMPLSKNDIQTLFIKLGDFLYKLAR